MTQHSPVCVFANVCACACACARACVRACVSALTLPTRTLRRLHEPHAFLLVAGPPGGLQALSRAEAALVALGAQFRFPRVRAAEATTLHCARCSCSVRVRVRELFLPDPNHHAAEWCMSVRAGYQCFTQSTIPLWLRQDQTWLRGANGRPRHLPGSRRARDLSTLGTRLLLEQCEEEVSPGSQNKHRHAHRPTYWRPFRPSWLLQPRE